MPHDLPFPVYADDGLEQALGQENAAAWATSMGARPAAGDAIARAGWDARWRRAIGRATDELNWDCLVAWGLAQPDLLAPTDLTRALARLVQEPPSQGLLVPPPAGERPNATHAERGSARDARKDRRRLWQALAEKAEHLSRQDCAHLFFLGGPAGMFSVVGEDWFPEWPAPLQNDFSDWMRDPSARSRRRQAMENAGDDRVQRAQGFERLRRMQTTLLEWGGPEADALALVFLERAGPLQRIRRFWRQVPGKLVIGIGRKPNGPAQRLPGRPDPTHPLAWWRILWLGSPGLPREKDVHATLIAPAEAAANVYLKSTSTSATAKALNTLEQHLLYLFDIAPQMPTARWVAEDWLTPARVSALAQRMVRDWPMTDEIQEPRNAATTERLALLLSGLHRFLGTFSQSHSLDALHKALKEPTERLPFFLLHWPDGLAERLPSMIAQSALEKAILGASPKAAATRL